MESNKKPKSDKQLYDQAALERLLKKGDFKAISDAAHAFRRVIKNLDFKPNAFWGEDRPVFKLKPDLLTELVVCLYFYHSVDDNLSNYKNNLSVILILSGHMNIYEAFYEVNQPDSIYYEALWELYGSITQTVDELRTRAENPSGLSKFEKEVLSLYFYEYFLEVYDPELRKDLGIWYTPQSIVNFINNNINYLLEKHFPTKNPTFLDFATGTGMFLLDRIKREYEAQKDKMDKGTLKYHLFNACTGVELNDFTFILTMYNINVLVYTLLDEWTGEIPLIDINRPIILPLYNGNTLQTTGFMPYLGNNQHHENYDKTAKKYREEREQGL